MYKHTQQISTFVLHVLYKIFLTKPKCPNSRNVSCKEYLVLDFFLIIYVLLLSFKDDIHIDLCHGN